MSEIDKNTVKAENQLVNNDIISHIHPEGTGLRVLFVGNSITRHGIKPDIGWLNDWGMAASAQEKDYVHLVAKSVLEKDPSASFCICQAAQWEINCYQGDSVFYEFQAARDFDADVIIMRLVENCPRKTYDQERFQEAYGALVSFLDPSGKAKKIITTSFWRRQEDDAIRLYAQSHGYPLVELGDLGGNASMKAIGLFEHSGVAIHPGDLGMQTIAERILKAMEAGDVFTSTASGENAGPVTFAICGFGSRGCDAYATYQRSHPDEMKITAVADPRASQRQIAMDVYQVPREKCYYSGEELLAQPKLADVLIISTQDQDHYRYAIPALEKGYHLLLEKPISPNLKECLEIRETAKRMGRIVMVCHVLRYAPFYETVSKLIREGLIGRLQHIDATENIGFAHFCHSYVRGNWRRVEESSPIIMAKSCHDMDILRWLVGQPCKRVSSFGGLDWFREENAPEGSAMRCLECALKDECPASAVRIYLTDSGSGILAGNKGWPCNVITGGVPTEETVREALTHGPYGRCVFRSDNTAADHQTVTMEFEGGVTANFYLSAFSNKSHRTICVQGTEGEIWGDSKENRVYLQRFGQAVQVFNPAVDETNFAGHGGGDAGMVRELCRMIREKDSNALTGIEASVESHVMALAAEESRVCGGKSVNLNDFSREALE